MLQIFNDILYISGKKRIFRYGFSAPALNAGDTFIMGPFECQQGDEICKISKVQFAYPANDPPADDQMNIELQVLIQDGNGGTIFTYAWPLNGSAAAVGNANLERIKAFATPGQQMLIQVYTIPNANTGQSYPGSIEFEISKVKNYEY